MSNSVFISVTFQLNGAWDADHEKLADVAEAYMAENEKVGTAAHSFIKSLITGSSIQSGTKGDCVHWGWIGARQCFERFFDDVKPHIDQLCDADLIPTRNVVVMVEHEGYDLEVYHIMKGDEYEKYGELSRQRPELEVKAKTKVSACLDCF